MATGISFNQSGSNANDPLAGIQASWKSQPAPLSINTAPAGTPASSPVSSGLITGTGQYASTNASPSTYGKVTGVLAPSNPTGAGTSAYQAPAQTATPSPYAGGKAPDDPSNMYNTATGQLNPNYQAPLPTPTPNSPVNTTPPGTLGNPGTSFQQNLANVQTASTPNPAYQNTISQAKPN